MTDALDYRPVLRAYTADCQPQSVEFLNAAGGFSGARLWRLTTPRGLLCLRRWPSSHPPRDRLEFIQAVLWHVQQEGFDRVPLPLETSSHAGYVVHAGHFWELAPWLPGASDYAAAPSAPRRRAALEALAEFHQAAASFPLAEPDLSPSPGIHERAQQLSSHLSAGFADLQSAVGQVASSDPFAADATRIVELIPQAAPRVHSLLSQAARAKIPLQPCLRDIWADNVLFVGDQVTGLVDFGALRPENVAADIARLLGSMAEDDRAAWSAGLAAYEEQRPLAEIETVLVAAFDVSGVLLGAANWISWLFIEGRTFADPRRVQDRLAYFRRRLEVLAAGWA